MSALICYTRTREYSGKFSSQQDADRRCSAWYIKVEIPRNQQLRQHLKTNRVLETIIVIRPITVTILITDLPPRNYLPPAIHAAVIVSPTLSLSCRHNNDRTAAVITRKCNFSIGNYHGVSFSGVIATNLPELHRVIHRLNLNHQLCCVVLLLAWHSISSAPFR